MNLTHSSSLVRKCYEDRKKSFYNSLHKTLQQISKDKLSKQILQNETSERYIAHRIEEVFEKVVSSDREDFIDSLIQKLDAYEQDYQNNEQLIIRVLGENFIKSAKSDDSGKVNHVSLLLQKIHSLKKELDEERQKAEMIPEKVRIDLEKEPDFYIVNDRGSPNYMHTVGKIDLTLLQQDVKEISNEMEMFKSHHIYFKRNTLRLISLIHSKMREAISIYSQKMIQLKDENITHQAEYEEAHERSENEINLLKVQLQERIQDITEFKLSIQQKDDEIGDLSLQLKQKTESLEDAHEQNENLQKQIFSMKEDATTYQDRMEEIMKENIKLKKDLDQFIASHDDSVLFNEKREKEYRQNIILLEDMKQKNERLQQRLDKRKEQMLLIKQKFIQITQDMQELQTKCAEQRQANQELVTQNQSLSEQVSQLNTQVEDVQITNDDIKLTSETTIAQLQTEVVDSKKKIHTLESQLIELKNINDEQKEEYVHLLEWREKHKDDLKETKETNENLSKEVEKLKLENENLISQNSSFLPKVNSLNETIESQKVKLSEQQKQIREYEQMLSDKDLTIDDLSVSFNKMKNSHDSRSNLSYQLKEENSILSQEKRELQNNFFLVQSQYKRSAVKQDELQTALQDTTKKLDKMKVQNEKLTKDLESILQAARVRTVSSVNDILERSFQALKQQQTLQIILSVSGNTNIVEKVRELQSKVYELEIASFSKTFK